MNEQLEQLAADLTAYQLEQQPEFTFDFYTEIHPNYVIRISALLKEYPDFLTAADRPPDTPGMRYGNVRFQDGVYHTRRPRLAAVLSLQPDVKHDDWLQTAVAKYVPPPHDEVTPDWPIVEPPATPLPPDTPGTWTEPSPAPEPPSVRSSTPRPRRRK